MRTLRFVFVQESGRLRSGWRLLILLVAVVGAIAATSLILETAGLPDATPEGSVRLLPLAVGAFVLLASVLLVIGLMMRLFERRWLSTMGFTLDGPWLRGLGAG